MGKLNELCITIGINNKAELIFDSLYPNFLEVEKREARSLKAKIKNGSVIGIDHVIVATDEEFNELIKELKEFELSEPPRVKVIDSNQIITEENVNALI